ncbi:MAG: dihydroorotate dehydrogenase electron transfer subunit [Thermodesulfobacteriota bacterium]
MPKTQIIEIASILANDEVAPATWRMVLSSPEIAGLAQPGQFVMVDLGGLDPLLRRPFSIHRCQDGGSLSLLYKVVGHGTGQMAALEPGRTLSLLGPLGHGFEIKGKSHILVGGGLGTAPLLMLAETMACLGKDQNITTLLGGRTAGEILVSEEFAPFGQVKKATDDGSLGHHGLVTSLLNDLSGPDQQVYSCGPEPMLRAVARICREKGWPCQVSLESHMACGMGACLGCAVEHASLTEKKYAHVCKDGPVFEAGAIWL